MPSTIFAPTLSGRPHIGTACNMLACAEMARIGATRLIRRLDMRDEPQRRLDPGTMVESRAALDVIAVILGIEFDETYTSAERRPRYMEMVDRLVTCGHTETMADGDISLRHTKWVEDVVHGPVRDYCCNLVYDGQPYSTVIAVTDAIDFDERIHVRGNDLIMDMVPEARLWDIIGPPREPLMYAHFPLICDANGKPLHKSDRASDALKFLSRFGTVDARRQVLLGMILRDPRGWFCPANIRQDYAVHIDEAGHVCGHTPWMETGIFATRIKRNDRECADSNRRN